MAGAADRQGAVVEAAILGYALSAPQPKDLVISIRAR